MDLPEEIKSCSRCEKPLDTTGYPLWCQSCRNKNQREYMRTRNDMSETRGFAAGITACKEFLAREFEKKIAGSPLTGFDTAKIIRGSIGPDLPQKESPPIAQRASAQ